MVVQGGVGGEVGRERVEGPAPTMCALPGDTTWAWWPRDSHASSPWACGETPLSAGAVPKVTGKMHVTVGLGTADQTSFPHSGLLPTPRLWDGRKEIEGIPSRLTPW